MNTRDKTELRKKKSRDRLRFLILIAAVLYFGSLGFYGWALALIPVFYVCHEVLWSDHIFYDPGRDYLYRFTEAGEHRLSWGAKNKTINIPSLADNADTSLLALKINTGLMGKAFDPFIELSAGNKTIRQYVERGVKGLRYINISSLVDEVKLGGTIQVNTRYCKCSDSQPLLLTFNNPDLEDKKVLIIAPHADDAELAAFGLYSECQSFIVTVTAGEVEADDFRIIYQDIQLASLLKGRLRSLDGVTAAVWGGVNPQNIINLGYFCQCLQEMRQKPNKAVASKTADIADTRLFREFNQLSLSSDQNGLPTWNNLLADLTEILQKFSPDIIVTPHPQLDPHGDHIYATRAILQAVSEMDVKPEYVYYYANHFYLTDHHPFGPAHTAVSLPPNFEPIEASAIVSYPLSMKKQKDKIFALEVMHDLKTKLKTKKRIRRMLQSFFINRPITAYGEDEFFRKTIRANELFYRVKTIDALKWLQTL